MRSVIYFLMVIGAGIPGALAQTASKSAGPKLLLAFSSVRERRAPPYPKVYFYEHDGVAAGKLLGSIDSITKGTNFTRADMHPSLSRDGRFCAFCSQYGIQDGGRIEIWDRQEKKLATLPTVHDLPRVHQMSASMSGDGKFVAFSAWNWPGGNGRWGVYVYDVAAKKVIDLPKLSREAFDQRLPAISGDGRLLAYASNAKEGAGLTDVYLYDLTEKKIVPVPAMNSPRTDMQPSLSGDGRLVAFTSDRPGGKGGRDVYLYDRAAKQFQPLPGLNTEAHEQSPALSADGRYLAFVSERLGGAGERDIYLYDRETQKLLPIPELNSKDDDYDPWVIVAR